MKTARAASGDVVRSMVHCGLALVQTAARTNNDAFGGGSCVRVCVRASQSSEQTAASRAHAFVDPWRECSGGVDADADNDESIHGDRAGSVTGKKMQGDSVKTGSAFVKGVSVVVGFCGVYFSDTPINWVAAGGSHAWVTYGLSRVSERACLFCIIVMRSPSTPAASTESHLNDKRTLNSAMPTTAKQCHGEDCRGRTYEGAACTDLYRCRDSWCNECLHNRAYICAAALFLFTNA